MKIRNNKGQFILQKTVDEEFFQKESSELAYILGLLASDGNVYKNIVSFSQSGEEGLKLVNSFKKLVNFSGTISKKVYENPKHNDSYTISFVSKCVVDRLEDFGIIPNKSLVYKFPKNLNRLYWGDFLRGYIDGDGSVFTYVRNKKKQTKKGIKEYPDKCNTISLFGSIPFCEFIYENFPIKPNKKIRYKGNGAEIVWNYKTARELGKYIYSNSILPATKKQQKYREF